MINKKVSRNIAKNNEKSKFNAMKYNVMNCKIPHKV